jgi:hypothetical protein
MGPVHPWLDGCIGFGGVEAIISMSNRVPGDQWFTGSASLLVCANIDPVACDCTYGISVSDVVGLFRIDPGLRQLARDPVKVDDSLTCRKI